MPKKILFGPRLSEKNSVRPATIRKKFCSARDYPKKINFRKKLSEKI